MEKRGIPTIDLVVVNLYPFSQTVARPDCTLRRGDREHRHRRPGDGARGGEELQERGGRTDPADYAPIAARNCKSAGGTVAPGTALPARLQGVLAHRRLRRRHQQLPHLAWTAKAESAAYFPQRLNLNFKIAQDLRYGENPHQQAAFYRDLGTRAGQPCQLCQLQGKELSYNNIADADAAWECVKTFDAAGLRHRQARQSLRRRRGRYAARRLPARLCHRSRPPPSAASSRSTASWMAPTAEAVSKQFVEVIIAPQLTTEAPADTRPQSQRAGADRAVGQTGSNAYDFKRVGGGLLVQTPDTLNVTGAQLKVVTKAKPTPQQLHDLLFAWRVAKFVKSNAIVFCANGQTLGVGAGQMSRVDSARIAAIKAQNAGLTLAGSAVASDAFFPFRDGLDVVVQAGATAVIQPGGSVRDDEVIAAADEQGIAMVFTGVRHFRH